MSLGRIAKGLPPLSDPEIIDAKPETKADAPGESSRTGAQQGKQKNSLSFNSSGSTSNKGKRKAAVLQSEDLREGRGGKPHLEKKQKKKAKPERKTLLSFGDDA